MNARAFSQRRSGLDPARRLVTVHARKLDIHQDKIGPLYCYDRRRRLSFRERDLCADRDARGFTRRGRTPPPNALRRLCH
jgi:hypothetical protein